MGQHRYVIPGRSIKYCIKINLIYTAHKRKAYTPFCCVTTKAINKPLSQSTSATIYFARLFVCLFTQKTSVVLTFTIREKMDIKSASLQQQQQFDVSKICRACLTEKGEMRSVFLVDESIGQAIRLAEMIMGFSSIQVRLFSNADNFKNAFHYHKIYLLGRYTFIEKITYKNSC